MADRDPLMDRSIRAIDPVVADAIARESRRQRDHIELIASENYTYAAVREAQGSVLTNKYAEGYPGRRYYAGCEFVDDVENLARERALQLYPGSEHVNVQPHSGASANLAAFAASMQPGDRFVAMDLSQGGHLSHGAAVNVSGKWFAPTFYGVRPDDGLVDWDGVERAVATARPKIVIAGASAYPRTLDFERFAAIAHAHGAQLLVDMAHISGLVAAGAHPSPFPHADWVTSTTHKTLRGPRGGFILMNAELEKLPKVSGAPAALDQVYITARLQKVFAGAEAVRFLRVPHEFSRGELAKLEEVAKQWGARGLAYLVYRADGEVASPIAKFLGDAEHERFRSEPGTTVLFGADTPAMVSRVLGALRLHLGREHVRGRHAQPVRAHDAVGEVAAAPAPDAAW